LQLYAQSVLQEGAAALQADFLKLRSLAGPASHASTASFLAAGLRLLDAAFTPPSEHQAILRALEPHAHRAIESGDSHPRLVFESGRLLLRLRRPDEAQELFERLPQSSPLRETADQYLTHHRNIANSQAAAAVYTVT